VEGRWEKEKKERKKGGVVKPCLAEGRDPLREIANGIEEGRGGEKLSNTAGTKQRRVGRRSSTGRIKGKKGNTRIKIPRGAKRVKKGYVKQNKQKGNKRGHQLHQSRKRSRKMSGGKL